MQRVACVSLKGCICSYNIYYPAFRGGLLEALRRGGESFHFSNLSKHIVIRATNAAKFSKVKVKIQLGAWENVKLQDDLFKLLTSGHFLPMTHVPAPVH